MNKTKLNNLGLLGLAATMLTGGDRPIQSDQPVIPNDHITTLVDEPTKSAAPFQTGIEKMLTVDGKDVVAGYLAFLENAKGSPLFTLDEYSKFDRKTQEVITTLAQMGIWDNLLGAAGDPLTVIEISQLGNLFDVDTEYIHAEPKQFLYLNAGDTMALTSLSVLTYSGGAQTNAIQLSRNSVCISLPIRGYSGPSLKPNEPLESKKRIDIQQDVTTAGASSIVVLSDQDYGPIQVELMHPSWVRPDLTPAERDDAYQFAIKKLIGITPDLVTAIKIEKFLDSAFMHTDGSRLYFPNTDYDFSLVQLDTYPLVVITDRLGQKWTIRTRYPENERVADTLMYSDFVTGMSVALDPEDPSALNWTLHHSMATGSPYRDSVGFGDVTFKGTLDWPAQSGIVNRYEEAMERHAGMRLLNFLGYPLEAPRIQDIAMHQMFIRAFDKATFDPHTFRGSWILSADLFEWEITDAAVVIKGIDPLTNEPVVLTLLSEYYHPTYFGVQLDGDLNISIVGVSVYQDTSDTSTYRVGGPIVASFVGDATDTGDFRLSSSPNFR